jgi:hypothetical protein
MGSPSMSDSGSMGASGTGSASTDVASTGCK